MLPAADRILKIASDAGSAAPAERTGRRWCLAAFIFFAAICIPCAMFSIVASPAFTLSDRQHGKKPLTSMTLSTPPPEDSIISNSQSSPLTDLEQIKDLESEDLRLERVLKGAATADRTVIVTTSNAAWSAPGSIMDVFLESFEYGNGTAQLLKHLLIVALDPTAYLRCKIKHPHCFYLTSQGMDLSEEKTYMSDGYLKLVWKKLDILRIILAKGYNFLFTDADVMWFRDPFPHFNPDADFQSSCDFYGGDPASMNNWANTGFKYVKASNRTVQFYNFWYESRLRFPGQGQQGVLRKIKFDPRTKEIGISLWFLDWDCFGSLCRPPKDLSKVVTMHATCCVGLKNKLHDMKVLQEDWGKFASLPPRKREVRQYSWSELRFQCRCLCCCCGSWIPSTWR